MSNCPLFLSLLAMVVLGHGPAQISQQARQLHDSALVFDAHVHIINRQFYQGGDIGDREAGG